MTVASRLLHAVYRREEPILQANDWGALRVPLNELVAELPEVDRPGAHAAIVQLRKRGAIMLLPDWARWGTEEDEQDGTVEPSEAQWESVGEIGHSPPRWNPRPVFLPTNLDRWFVRSRVAETVRLLASNRERFGLEPSAAHVGYLLQQRKRPTRGVPVAQAVERLRDACDAGEYATADAGTLKAAIAVAGDGLLRTDPPRPTIAAFQERAWHDILRSLFGQSVKPDATIITAGVSSGKTYAFLLPALTLLVYRALRGEGGVPRVLVVYPRVSLVEDQFSNLQNLLRGVNAALAASHPGHALTDQPALDAGSMLGSSLGSNGALGDVIPLVRSRRIELILTTPESLKNRMLDPRAVAPFLRDVEVVVLDEVHLMEGLAGCQQVYLLRRLRELMRELRGQTGFRPAWVAASATLARPVEHAGRVFSVPPERERVAHVHPGDAEMEPFSLFHHVFVHTRVGKPAISAVTNGLSCLTHTRNDGTAHTHYADPVQLVPRDAREMPKTIAFVDSLSTIGRLDFTTRDNERCRDADRLTPYPYYTWFYRPAARLRATASEFDTREKRAARDAVREWCEKCYHGVPARVEADALQRIPLPLRTHSAMGPNQERRATPPGLPELVAGLSGQVGNLDECPYHRARVCWWFSGDRGDTQTVGGVRLYIDQNRTVAYTSRSEEAAGRGLRDDVNEYFGRAGRGRGGLWSVTQSNDALYPTLPAEPQRTGTMLASPKIEVGVDFDNVRDGLTHKAIRSAASFQQKVGRVGREGGTDCLIATFLAHRSTDAHFAHHPERLIDSRYLDPIPLAAENPDARATHLFTAVLEYIGCRSPGQIANAGERLNVIGTGSNREPGSWEAKVRACRAHLVANRASVCGYILRATAEDPTAAPAQEFIVAADAAINQFCAVLDVFLVDLAPAFVEGRTAAHWFKLNQRPNQVAAFGRAMEQRATAVEALGREEARGGLPAPVAAAVGQLRVALEANDPAATSAAGPALLAACVTAVGVPGADAARIGPLMAFDGAARAVAAALPAMPADQLRTLMLAREVLFAFFGSDFTPQTELYYLHDVLTRLTPFRTFYPHGLLRTHFQPIQARSVIVRLPGGGAEGHYREEVETLDAALFELLPGTWNYRWVRGFKSPCDRVEQVASGGWCVILDRVADRATFEDTGTRLAAADLPPDMPLVPGREVHMLRPVRLTLRGTAYQPLVRPQDGLIGDEDEADPIGATDDETLPRCPTLPRAFPATWYRIAPAAGPLQTVIGEAAPGSTCPAPHGFPAFGRVWLDRVEFDERMTVDRYVYALDRTTGTWVESPRLHYRRGTDPVPVVLGDTLHETDGLRYRLNAAAVSAVLDETVAARGPVRGEVTLRALRRFVARAVGCDPFRSAMFRKVIATAFLDGGGRLDSFDAAAVRAVLAALDPLAYEAVAARLVSGSFAGSDLTETPGGAQRQAEWYERAQDDFSRLRAAAAQFTDDVVRDTGRDLLTHTLAVAGLDAAAQLVGAADDDLGYFHDAVRGEFYLFDCVDGGNGYAETVRDYLHVPPLRRIMNAREDGGALPTSDWFGLFDQISAACPAQLATRVVFAACVCGATDRRDVRLPAGVPVRDLEARIRHEFDGVTGSAAVVRRVLAEFPGVFRDWPDLLWLQVVPEYFASRVCGAGLPARSFTDLVTRTRVCVTGCLECVDNAEGSVYGSLASAEHVSRPLLDAAVRHVRRSEPAAFHLVPAGADLGHELQARAGRPVLSAGGTPATVAVRDGGANRDVMITQVLGGVAVAPDAATGPLLEPDGGGWAVRLPFIASYRDERGQP